MPIVIAPWIALAFGVGLAWIGRVDLARAELPLVLTRPFGVACALAGLVLAPVLAYFLAFHADWSYLYVVRTADIPSALDLLVVLAVSALVPGGLALASPLAVARRGPLLARVASALVVIAALIAVVAARRLSVSATYSQYQGGYGAVPIGRSALGSATLLAWITLIAGFAWSARALSRRAV